MNFHEATNHSYHSIRESRHFLDFNKEPRNYKIYPDSLKRFKLNDFEIFKSLGLIGGISCEKNYHHTKYYLRTNPSAGALYPCEVYLQIRNVEGFKSGLYHYEPLSARICLLNEINNDGVEYYFKDKKQQDGIIFLVSSIYFRSSWKYRNRSIRYILLDSGHILGSIYAALNLINKDTNIIFDFDKISLNEKFGFRDDEMFTCAIKSTIKTKKDCKKLNYHIPYVSGSDFLETNNFIEDSYSQSAKYDAKDIDNINFLQQIDKQDLKSAIIKRRSIREFKQQNITKNEFDFIVKDLFNFANQNNIDIYYTVHNVISLKKALYKNGEIIKEGDFHSKSKYLSLEQSLAGDSCVTFYFTSNETKRYQMVNILSGFLSHIIYLRSQLQQIGCSGIGAFYDDETKEFLDTKNNILYLVVIGK